jgi:hypothetical protein
LALGGATGARGDVEEFCERGCDERLAADLSPPRKPFEPLPLSAGHLNVEPEAVAGPRSFGEPLRLDAGGLLSGLAHPNFLWLLTVCPPMRRSAHRPEGRS